MVEPTEPDFESSQLAHFVLSCGTLFQLYVLAVRKMFQPALFASWTLSVALVPAFAGLDDVEPEGVLRSCGQDVRGARRAMRKLGKVGGGSPNIAAAFQEIQS